jgi:hypothetical protein
MLGFEGAMAPLLVSPASTFSFETTSAGSELVARSLASLAAVLLAGGYALVLCGEFRRPEHVVTEALTRISVGAVGAAALITVWQLLVVNDTVALLIRLALWALVVTGIVGTASVVIARRLMSRTPTRTSPR